MPTLSITSRGQVTFRREILQHLGLRPGDKIEVDLLPDGRAQLTAARPRGAVSALVGVAASRTNGARLTIGEIEATVAGVREPGAW